MVGLCPKAGISHIHVCKNSIVTFGEKDLVLGFANALHVDKTDRFSDSVQHNVLELLKVHDDSTDKRDVLKCAYAESFVKTIGLGVPTTCVYQFVGTKDMVKKCNVIQYFVMHGIGLCIQLKSHVAHMFYAHTF